jgi:hypothetical protein
MNTTNSPAELAALQQLAGHAGYNLSGPEIALLASVAAAVVHAAHGAVAAWGRMGGYQGVKAYFLKGDKP